MGWAQAPLWNGHYGVNMPGGATEQGNENLPNLKVASIHFIVHALTQWVPEYSFTQALEAAHSHHQDSLLSEPRTQLLLWSPWEFSNSL